MKTILVAQFKHETNTFAPGITDRKVYEARNALIGETQIRAGLGGAKIEITGLLDFFQDKADVALLPVLAFDAMPGPRVAQSVFDEVKDLLLASLDAPVDGILLSLHGAMVTTELEDGEGTLLEVLRQKVGNRVPIIVTLDLHANITQKMVEYATALFVCDDYPHTDMYETGLRAAACMYETLCGEVSPVMKWCKLPLIIPCTSTMEGVMKQLTDRFRAMRSQTGVLNMNLAHGFFRANIYELGMAVVAVTDGDEALAEDLAERFAHQVWQVREQLKYSPLTADEAIDAALRAEEYPVVLADVADNPGGGGTCDGVELLERLIQRQADAVVAAICDPETAMQAAKAGIGATITANIGGKAAPEITGEPVHCSACVKNITDGKYRNTGPAYHGLLMDHGVLAVLEVGAVTVLVGSNRVQAWDAELLRSCGIRPEAQKIIVVKSAVHYRGAYQPFAHRMLSVETAGTASQRIENFDLDRCRRPMYPLDKEVTFVSGETLPIA